MSTKNLVLENGVPVETPVIEPGHTLTSVTEKISDIVLVRPISIGWVAGLLMCGGLASVLAVAVGYLFYKGTGIWGINIPVGWGFAIVNFVWWIGIGHAGTLISAILHLLRQSWRNSINRFAEAMTLFAVMCAGVFPLIHVGRPWLAYWLFPIPNTMGIWPQFRSPLLWDVFAVSTYATISAVFWYTGLIPDLATLRDRATTPIPRFIYGALALGWRGEARHWHRYESAYLLLAGLSTPLVLSVHTVVSFDFAISIMPGWHTTVFPPYFVAGAIYSGFAMVLILAIPVRAVYNLKDMITLRHLENAAKVMLATGLIVAYGYILEIYMAWYSGPKSIDWFTVHNRFFGPYAGPYWALWICNIIIPQVLWIKSVRRSPFLLFLISLVVLAGMWLERFVIVILSLHRDYVPSSWGMYYPTKWDWMTYFGTIGLFLTLIFLFVRVLPMISIFEIRMLLPEAEAKHK
jgi:molybdopterin-containing oxidoreductase family membrane subunit